MKISEKKIKWGCIILLLLILCFVLFGAIDMERFQSGKKPLFIIREDNIEDGGTTVYYGIGYQLISWRKMGENSEGIPGDSVGKECHVLFYRDINDGPSEGVPLVFEPWNQK